MQLFCDTNIMAHAVAAMRSLGHDVVHSAERAGDPGDAALLAEALLDRRVFVTKDHDIGVLVYGKGAAHAGVLLIDDLGDPIAETALLRSVLLSHAALLGEGRFLRAGEWGVRVGEDPKRHTAT